MHFARLATHYAQAPVIALATVFLLCSLEGCLVAPSPAASSTESGTVPSSDGDITPSQAKPIVHQR